MNRHTHILFALALTAWVLRNASLLAMSIALVSSTIGSVLPDLDLRLKHRKTLHNIFALALFTLAVYMFIPRTLCPHACLIGFAVGWGSHIFLDALTKKGVSLFYPLSNFNFKVGLCRSDSPVCNVFFSVLSVVLMIARLLS